ncbi:hypothetical protein BST91_03595 [Nonlabens tegetincola]|uniref:restriction endonuclease subunit S n=1 Tax=Nonlabens tegetincola TaxID=323273 RepID=UPI000A20504C|nr:restriction endonuclease subunit S [Nonlabens tegetincola]ARN70795.1 hypothetical protein BST91_03595 [Nonlabens tegetincola]
MPCVVTIGSIGKKLCLTKVPSFTNQAINAIIVNTEKYDPDFVFYLMKYNLPQVKNLSSGTASGRENVSKTSFGRIKVKLPKHLPTQKKIASVLSAYDDLIENNNQRIQLLEDMAQEIYKEWFVRFRFPNYQNTTFADKDGNPVPHGTKGAIPEGWKKQSLGNRYDISLGGTPSRENEQYWNGNIAWINSGKVNETRVFEPSEYISEIGLSKSATKLLPKKTTLLAITGATLGQVSFLEIESCTNQSIVGIKDVYSKEDEFIFLTMKNKIKELMNYAGGGAQQHINKAIVEDYEILIPNDSVLKRFREMIKPKFDLLANLLFQNQVLQDTRDLLLPRLISGKLSVDNITLPENELQIAAEAESPTYTV